jgi:hypothetical protein
MIERLKGCRLLLIWGWVALVPAGPARAGSVTLSAAVDAGYFQSSPAFATLIGGSPASLFALQNSFDARAPQFAIFSGVEFDLSSIPKNAVITSASLMLTVIGAQQELSLPNLHVFGAGDNSGTFTRSDFTALINFSSPPDQIGFVYPIPGMQNLGLNIPENFNITAFIQSLVNSGTRYAKIQFSANQSAVNLGGPGSGRTAPTLTIASPSIAPEPPGVVLLGLGIVGLAVVERRHGACARRVRLVAVAGRGRGGHDVRPG